MNLFGSDFAFAFLRPLWLIGWLAIPFLAWGQSRLRAKGGWEQYIPKEKLRHLEIESSGGYAKRQSWILVALAVAITALAGPSWRKLPVPIGQSRDAMIIAFDLSPSMLATDINPDRLTRARLKLIDLLRRRQDGETALIAYSGGAHRVAPLTDDTETIEVLVPSLHPSVMPIAGSEVEAAVTMASELLTGAALERATFVLITDGIDPNAYSGIEEQLAGRLDLCLLVVGSEESVPIPLPRGGFLRDARGQTRLTTIDRGSLRRFAEAQGGCFVELRPDDADIDTILRFAARHADSTVDESDRTFDVRQDEGFWLALLLLPVALIVFRKNVLWTVALACLLPVASPSPAAAYEWADLWQRKDQRLEERMNAGIGAYRAERYDEAARLFQNESALGHYNRANALAFEGKLEEAIASYQAALESDPSFEDAEFNKSLLEELLEKEEEPQQDPQDSDESDEDDTEKQEGDSEESEESQESESSQDSKEDGSSDPSDRPPQDESEDASPSEESSDGEEEQPSEPEPSEPAEPSELEEDAEAQLDGAESSEPEQPPLSDQSEQWLRNIPDDPGGLLRRKFQYEADLRRRSGQQNAPHERY